MKTSLLACLAALSLASLPAFAASHWNGGRTVPVHKLAPRDAEGEKVSPSGRLPRPISLAQTCGQCHDVAAMHRGSHFRTGLDAGDAPASVTVEPWFWADEATGTASKLDAMEDLFRSYGIRQLTRTGKIAMSRGARDA